MYRQVIDLKDVEYIPQRPFIMKDPRQKGAYTTYGSIYTYDVIIQYFG